MQFNLKQIDDGLSRLRERGIPFEDGLNDSEISQIESTFGFRFPPDVRHFLQCALPVGDYFAPWRKGTEELGRWFLRPSEGVLFDVENIGFWHREWGRRPDSIAEALQVARTHLARVPLLIPLGDPIYLKCVPAAPCLAGNPVFSVNQTDVLHAGSDLADFLRWFARPREEFARDESEGVPPTPIFSSQYRSIPFWTDLARQNLR